ncbi:unnamed protein product [Effrenium voratum]|uniref:Uncharacterized protein n=1 Tax=Effrenium voratum TaxID=2562239 RepID=A0AA36HVX0_9DINO|nr:unnamed protein product [Effrenium voratum]
MVLLGLLAILVVSQRPQALGLRASRTEEKWEFKGVEMHSGDKFFDKLFNKTLGECVNAVATNPQMRGRCYDQLYTREIKCLNLRKGQESPSCEQTLKCLKGEPIPVEVEPCEWLCQGGGEKQKAIKANCSKAYEQYRRWKESCDDEEHLNETIEIMETVNHLTQQCAEATTSTTTAPPRHLYCWVLVVPWTYEVELLLTQQKIGRGIFECDYYDVYSDRDMQLGKIQTIKVDTDLHCPINKYTLTAENTGIFRAVWKKVLDRGTWQKYDWTVKVDLDTVFWPQRLIQMVQEPFIRQHAQTGTGLWLNNCVHGLHGPIEVLSRQAMQIYISRWNDCQNVANHVPQEDVYLRKCMDHLGVWKSDNYILLAEDHCDHSDYYKCEGNFVAYHPFKAKDQWLECRQKG